VSLCLVPIDRNHNGDDKMPMTQSQIDAAVRERLETRWSSFFKSEGAAPLFVFGVKQLPGPEYSVPVIAMDEDVTASQLLVVVESIARSLRANIKAK